MVILIKGVIIICISCISTCSILPEHCTGRRKFKVFCFQQITKKNTYLYEMPKMFRFYYTPTSTEEGMFKVPAVRTPKGKNNRLCLQSLN